MKKRSVWLTNGILAVASIAAALVATEIGVRWLDPQPTGLTYQDRFGLAMHWPGITRYLPQYGHEVSFNSAGMRDREHKDEKPPEVFRILLLGDSFMEALQVPFEASLPSLLETELQSRTGRRVEVVSAGVGGWGTDDELRYLTGYGLRYHPDLVIVAMTLHNDISDNLRQDWHKIQGGELVEQPRAPASFLGYKVIQVKAYLATRLQLYQLWRRVRHGREMRQVGQQLNSHVTQLFQEPTSDRVAEGVKLTGLLLREIQQVSGRAGAEVVLVLLPIKHQLSDSSFAAFVQATGLPAQQFEINRPQELITPLADSLGMPVIDLLPAFREWAADSTAPLYLEWDGHWNEAGHRVAAKALVRGLIATGSLQ